MRVEDLLAQVEALGVVVTLDRNDLVLRPKSLLTPDLVEELRAHKPELFELVVLRGWPESSRDAVRRYRTPEARLYPFVGEPVTTPRGPGRLVGVLPNRATVALEGKSGRVVHLLPSEVGPPDLAADLEHPFETVN